MKILSDENIDFYLAYPEIGLKTAYMKRFIDRGNNDVFLKRMYDSFEDHIDILEQIDFCKGRFVLKQGETLESVLLQSEFSYLLKGDKKWNN